jgi:hypothetical protein
VGFFGHADDFVFVSADALDLCEHHRTMPASNPQIWSDVDIEEQFRKAHLVVLRIDTDDGLAVPMLALIGFAHERRSSKSAL